jgi:chlorite dismutase
MSNPTHSSPVRTRDPFRQHGGPPVQRQFVNFSFHKLDPAFRRLPDSDKEAARAEFARLFESRRDGLMCLSYSTAGLRPDTDFLLWRIASSPDAFQAQTRDINRTALGGYLSTPWSFVSMTKRSMYVDKTDPFHTAESRTHIIPGKRKYLFVYPFVEDARLVPAAARKSGRK